MAFDLDDSELRATRKMYGLDKEDDTFKISVPIVTNEELERIDLQIDKDLDGIVHEISKTVSKDKDIIILKRTIEKQQKEIEHQKEKRANQKKELAILNEKQKEFNKLVNIVNSYKGQFKRQQKEIEELKEINKQKYYHVVKSKELEEEINNAWENKIKAEIGELKDMKVDGEAFTTAVNFAIKELQSLLEKE